MLDFLQVDGTTNRLLMVYLVECILGKAKSERLECYQGKCVVPKVPRPATHIHSSPQHSAGVLRTQIPTSTVDR